MTLQVGDTASHSDLKRSDDARPINSICARGEDIIIAGAISEWVLTNLQQWRRVERHSRATFEVSLCPRSGEKI